MELQTHEVVEGGQRNLLAFFIDCSDRLFAERIGLFLIVLFRTDESKTEKGKRLHVPQKRGRLGIGNSVQAGESLFGELQLSALNGIHGLRYNLDQNVKLE